MNSNLLLVLKGFAMGIAEVIPGVSGGTIAFITGIYYRLIEAIKSFHPSLLKEFKEGGISKVWKSIDGTFLVKVFAGMGIGVVGGAFGITYLLETYPPAVWAFFFGLIASSVIYIGQKIDQWNFSVIIAFFLGTFVAYFITVAAPAQGSEHPLIIFAAGFIAISALILPGISGSFMLLLMGLYALIWGALKDVIKTQSWESIKIFLVFGSGALAGLAIFSRVLSWMFRHYEQITLATLTGFMLGSLNKIWPWRNVLSTRLNSKGEEVPFLETNVMPGGYEGDPIVMITIVSMIVGFVLVLILSRFDHQEVDPP